MKFIEERIFRVLMLLSLLMVAGFVLSVLWSIFSKGIPVLTWEMVTSLPGAGFYIGKEGGFLNAIVGSVYIVVGATIIGLIVSIPVVFYLNVYLKGTSRFGYIAGIPSIVYGAFAFTLMIVMGIKTSLLGGIIVESLLIIPILTRSMDEVARTIPKDLLEAAYSLGATKIETIGVVVRQIAPAIATATLLSIGRAMGDAAGVMFTAGFTDFIPESLDDKCATLPLFVFFQLSVPQIEVQNRAYAAAVVLTMIVLILSVSGRLIMRYLSKNRIV